MVKHNDEIESLAQLVASLTTGLVQTNRQVMELERRGRGTGEKIKSIGKHPKTKNASC
jgi:hypothetical protein